MTVSTERLMEFMRLYQEAFDEQIDEDEAREITARLIELYSLLAEPLPSEKFKISKAPYRSDGEIVRESA